MVYRDVVDALFEIGYRVAPFAHHILHQAIRFHNCALRIVHEAGLIGMPCGHETVARSGRKRSNMQLFDTLFAPLQLALSLGTVPQGPDGMRIFGTEPGPQTLTAL